jgi:hypothetical protein
VQGQPDEVTARSGAREGLSCEARRAGEQPAWDAAAASARVPSVSRRLLPARLPAPVR